MRLTKQRVVMLGAGVATLVVAAAAALGWWPVAVVLVAALQAVTLAAVIDTRGRMVRRSAVSTTSNQVKRLHRLVDNLGTRMLASAETGRVEVADRLTEANRAIDENRMATGNLEKQIADLVGGLDGWRSELRESRRSLEVRLDVTEAQLEETAGRLDEAGARLHRAEDVKNELSAVRGQVDAISEQLEQSRLKRSNRELLTLALHVRQIEALIQLYSRVSPRASMPSSGGWALNPTGLLTLLELIARHRPATVLEFGSGTSTVWMGYALESIAGARVISIDHNEEYAQRTRDVVHTHALDTTVEVRSAPLVESGLSGHDPLWYDQAAFGDLTGIDLVVIDGPPKATGALARYPAVPKLLGQLADGAVIALDDATRPDEAQVVQRWCDENPGLHVVPIPPDDTLKVLEFARSAGEQPL